MELCDLKIIDKNELDELKKIKIKYETNDYFFSRGYHPNANITIMEALATLQRELLSWGNPDKLPSKERMYFKMILKLKEDLKKEYICNLENSYNNNKIHKTEYDKLKENYLKMIEECGFCL